MQDTIYKKIKKVMFEKNINQTALAKKIGVSRGVVSGWFRGNRNPKKESLERIAKALDLPIAFFYDDGQKNFENSGIIGNNNQNNNFNTDMKDIKIQIQDHEIRILKLENEILKKELKKWLFY